MFLYLQKFVQMTQNLTHNLFDEPDFNELDNDDDSEDDLKKNFDVKKAPSESDEEVTVDKEEYYLGQINLDDKLFSFYLFGLLYFIS